MPTPCIADTNCIHLALTGVPATLSASPIIENTAQGGINLVCGTGGLADRVASGTTLPGGPKTRDEFYAGPGDVGLIWHLRYVTGRNKWQFLGGGPLHDEVANNDSVTSWGAYHDLAHVGPQVTMPFDGSYLVQFGAMIGSFVPDGSEVDATMTVENAGVGIGAYARWKVNVLTLDTIDHETSVSVMATKIITGTAGDALVAKYEGIRGGGSGTAEFLYRWLLVTPLEVS